MYIFRFHFHFVRWKNSNDREMSVEDGNYIFIKPLQDKIYIKNLYMYIFYFSEKPRYCIFTFLKSKVLSCKIVDIKWLHLSISQIYWYRILVIYHSLHVAYRLITTNRLWVSTLITWGCGVQWQVQTIAPNFPPEFVNARMLVYLPMSCKWPTEI